MRLEMETGRFYLGRDYCEAVERSGGIPVHIGLIPKPEYISAVLEDVDGVLLPGSNTDIDPRFYNEDPHPNLGTVIPEKDETDRLVLAEIEQRGLPLLAICYGMQALNVYCGGTLIQDISSQVDGAIKHQQDGPADRVSHPIEIEEGSLLSTLSIHAAEGRVNSSHHQAIKNVGENLRATAWAPDGIVECVEDTRADRFALGVQWHPEILTDELSQAIFGRFIDECHRRIARAHVLDSQNKASPFAVS